MKRIIAFCTIALAMMSCVKESISVSEYGQKTLTAKVESNNVTKVGFTDGTAEFFWTKCDEIGVTTRTSKTNFSRMALNDEDAGKASGTFNGSMSSDPEGYAVYPYIFDKHSMSGSTLTYYLPKKYKYTVLDATYANREGNSHNAPMWGAIEGGSVSFKHLGGVIAFEINGLPANTQNLTFKLTASKKINGNFTTDLAVADPQITTSDAIDDAEKSITVTFSTADAQTSGYIYVPVPTGTIGNLSAIVFDENSEVLMAAYWDNITIARKDIRRATIGNKTIVGGETLEVNSADEVTKALDDVDQGATDVTVEVKNEVAGADNTIEIPSTLQTETTTIVFNTISDNAVITINNEENGNYSGQVIIEIPETETIPKIEAIIPDGEVYIKQGKVTTLIVSSADNTTIIGSGVAVNELIVKKGNVKIENEGVVTTITRSEENTDAKTYVYMAEGVTAPTTNDENIIAMYMSEDAILVYDVNQLKDAVAYGEKPVKLLNDLTLSDKIVINKSIIFDGNGKILTYTGSDRAIDVPANENEQLDVTFKNLTVDCTASYCQRGINYNDDGKLTLDNVTVKGKNVTYALNLPGSSDNCVVTITDSNLSGNIALNVWGENCVINANNTIFTAVDNNSYEGYAAVKLNNDYATSAEGSVINITGGKIDVTGEAPEDTEAVSNGTSTGKINISDTTVVNGEIAEMVAVIRYTGGTSYSFYNIADAIAKAEAGETVILIRDVTASEIITINKPITLDGNGKTLTSTAGRAINVDTEGNVGIKNLTISAAERAINIINKPANVTVANVTATATNNAVMMATTATGAKLTVSDSNFTGLATVNVASANSQVEINNTNITNCDNTTSENYGAITVFKTATNSTVVVNGGTVVVTDDSVAASIGAQGATVTFNGTKGAEKVQTVVAYIGDAGYTTLDEAVTDAEAGETITLISDVTASEIITINKPITLDGKGKKLTSTAGRAINVSGADGVTIKNLTIDAKGERAINIIQNATNVTIDNVTATSANYTVNVAGSAPNAVVNIKNSTLNGLCTVNVAAKNANVTVDNSTVNCNDNNTTTGESYAALCLGKESIGGKIIATNTVVNVAEGSDSTKGRNGAENGTVTINGSTEDVAVMVAVITYPGPQYHSFTSIKGAIEFAQENDVITLIRDITISELIAINKAITLDLNGKTVTATSKKAFEVYNKATIKNGSIVAANRCVDTRTNVKLSLENVTLTADKYSTAYGNPQPLTIGGSVNGTEVSMSEVTINAGTAGYGIITFVKTSLTATNSNISGYSSLYVKPGSDNSVFNFVGSNLSGSTFDNDVEGNSFSTVAVRANNVTVNADMNSTVKATGNYCYAATFGGDFAGEEKTSGVKAKFAGEIEGKIFPSSTQLIGNELKVKRAYASLFSETGYVVSTVDSEGLITITATESTK